MRTKPITLRFPSEKVADFDKMKERVTNIGGLVVHQTSTDGAITAIVYLPKDQMDPELLGFAKTFSEIVE